VPSDTYSIEQSIEIVDGHAVFNDVVRMRTTSLNTQLSISQKALGTLPEDGNVMPKHVGATIRN
jgi:hypothetical protein